MFFGYVVSLLLSDEAWLQVKKKLGPVLAIDSNKQICLSTLEKAVDPQCDAPMVSPLLALKLSHFG